MPHGARKSQQPLVLHVPQEHGPELEVLTPQFQRLRVVPQPAHKAQRRIVHHMPQAGWPELEVLPPQRRGLVRELPRSSQKPLRFDMPELPQEARQELGVQPSEREFRLHIVPYGSCESLRHQLCYVPYGWHQVGQHALRPSGNTARRAHVQELRMQQVPPKRPPGVLLLVPRQHDRPDWRLM